LSKSADLASNNRVHPVGMTRFAADRVELDIGHADLELDGHP
jgi:hypothetical protein